MEIFADERRPVFACIDREDQVLAYACVDCEDQVLAYACVDCEDQVLTYAFCVMKETRGEAVMADYFLSLKRGGPFGPAGLQLPWEGTPLFSARLAARPSNRRL